MSARPDPRSILVAEDDEDDRLILQRALAEAGHRGRLRFVGDGHELLDLLLHGADTAREPPPDLVLLDLNMPRVDGPSALGALKAEARTRGIPIVVLTTSQSEEDVRRSYDLGAAGFITKPSSFRALVAAMASLRTWWLDTVRLPARQIP